MLPALLLLFFLSSTASELYKCKDDTYVLNSTNPTFFLNNTQIAGSQECTWNFTFSSSYVAEISINGSSLATKDDYVAIFALEEWSQFFTFNGGIDGSTNGSLHAIWPSIYFLLYISSDNDTTMILTVNISLKTLADKPRKHLLTAVNQQPHFVQFADWKEDTVITAQADNSGQLFLSVVAHFLEPILFSKVFVFAGSIDNLQLLGTLASITAPYTRLFGSFISKTDTLTFYCALGCDVNATLVINDYENVESLIFIDTIWSPYNRAGQNYHESYLMDASQGPVALTVLNEADGSNAIYLEKVEYAKCTRCLNNTSPVKVLVGGMIQDYDTLGTLLGEYKDWHDDNSYPQFLPGMARTFVLEEGQAYVHYISAVANTKETEAANGRKGFVMSNNYPFMSQDQNSQEFVLHSVDGKVFTFEYTIQQQNANSDAYLNFSVTNQTGAKHFTVALYNVTAPVISNLTALEMRMSIVGGNENSTGTYIPYRIISTANFSSDMAETAIGTTSSAPVTEVLIFLLLVLCLTVTITGAIFFVRYHLRRGRLRTFWVTVSGILPIKIKIDEWELGDKQLEVFEDKELGQGAFAIVYQGKLTGSRPADRIKPSSLRIAERESQVAVKRLPPKADIQARIDFLNEVNFMKKLGFHPHILGMIGCITASGLPLIVLDYCENGDLLSWVRKHKYSIDELQPRRLISIAWQISDGLCYLKSVNILHRDLAARNILLTKEIVAKISDFGLSREPEVADDSATYMPRFYVSRGGRLPIKWMAPESLRDFHFSFKTDVWSYGVLLWEMFTFGDVPFAAVQAPAMLEILENGERLPQGCISDPIYKLISSCWEAEPGKRASAKDMKNSLYEMATLENDYGYLMVSPAVDFDNEKDGKEDVKDFSI